MAALLLASHNPGKLREFRALLAPLGFDLLAAPSLGLAAADEPHPTFIENALAKARAAAAAAGMPALADDSGLCCHALDGAPGIRSARFAGEPSDDLRNNAELLRRLDRHADRRGHYVCVLAAVLRADDPEPLIAEARWHGRIITAPQGDGGFGYDPLFWLDDAGCTVAQLDAGRKNRISHRGRAMQQLLERLRREWIDGGAIPP
jgi:XTP/dITP diphosphohydrolase